MGRKPKTAVLTPEQIKERLDLKERGGVTMLQRFSELEEQNEKLKRELERMRQKRSKDPAFLQNQVDEALKKTGVNPFEIMAEIAKDSEDDSVRLRAASDLASYKAPKMRGLEAAADKDINISVEITNFNASNKQPAGTIKVKTAQPIDAEVVEPPALGDGKSPDQGGDSA